jgi:hypothetical protein
MQDYVIPRSRWTNGFMSIIQHIEDMHERP